MRIAIIGAGFTGLSAAYELTKKGHEVIIFEKDHNPVDLQSDIKKKIGNGLWKNIIIIGLPMIKHI
jgi:2-polyprenyl-6-methoxyphenol hydroxylase-like FAD-dependent oxidoreductase